MKFNICRNPYVKGVNLLNCKEIDIHPGLTVFVGCNGSGKSTLLKNIKDESEKNSMPCHLFNNLSDGKNNVLNSYLAGFGNEDDLNFGILISQLSEGETITANVNKQSTFYREFFSSGIFKDASYIPRYIFTDEPPEKINTNIRILLFDAVDSGLSIDTIINLKNHFHNIMKLASDLNIELYIIVSANTYELCDEEDCFDVVNGKYINFTSYQMYKNFILNSKELKKKRVEREGIWKQQEYEKELLSFNNQCDSLLYKIEEFKLKKESNSNTPWPSLREKIYIEKQIETLESFVRRMNISNNSLYDKIDNIKKLFNSILYS